MYFSLRIRANFVIINILCPKMAHPFTAHNMVITLIAENAINHQN